MDNLENKTVNKDLANENATLCLILAIASYPLICTLAGGVLTFIASVVLGILALKRGTTKVTQAVIGLAFDFVYLLICIAIIGFIWLVNDFGSVTVHETSMSPSGTYQVDIISYDLGATGGDFRVEVERASNGEFASVGDDKPRDGEEIYEAAASWSSSYEITWVSDDTFYLLPHNGSYNEIRVIRIELSEGGYSACEGYVTINRDESEFDHFEIDGDKVYYVCSVNITNTFDEPFEFLLRANAWKDKDGLLLEDIMISEAEDGSEMIYTIEPGRTENFEIVFTGEKGPSDKREEDDWLPGFNFVPVRYNPNYEP